MSPATHSFTRKWILIGTIGAAFLPSARASRAEEAPKKPVPQVVLLAAPAAGDGIGTGVLVRELARQSVLMSAREEFGALTRDELLREAVPSQPKVEPLSLEVAASQTREGDFLIQISKRTKDQTIPLDAFRIKVTESQSIAALTSQLEPMSRREFVQVLKQAGARADVRSAGSAKLPDVAAKQLRELVSLKQFAALRSIHGAIRQSGESPALLEGLIRGYATLGTLTEVHWNPAHKVFKARALLYAERFVARYPGPEAYLARAYVRALLGLHQAALDDLAASKTKSGVKQADQAIAESSILEAYCRADNAQLEKAAAGEHKMLATYLQMLLADSSAHFEVRQRAARAVLTLDGNCMRAAETLIHGAPLGVQRRASEQAMANFARSVYAEVLEIADLPEEERKLAKSVPKGEQEFTNRAALVKSLEGNAAGSDLSEPSTAVAGLLVRDTCFMQTWRWLDVRRHTLDWNMDGPLAKLRPIIEGHRYAPFIETHVWDPKAAAKPLNAIAELTNDPNLEFTEEPMIALLAQPAPEVATALQLVALQHSDVVPRDLMQIARHSDKELLQRRAAQLLREISPHWPATAATTILYDWEYAAPRAHEYEKRFSSNPDVLDNLAARFVAGHKLDDAQRCLTRRVEALPDQDGYKKLAGFYQGKGDDTAWVKTLEKSLDVPSYGLEKAGTLVELAQYYTNKGDLNEAAKKADVAAESYAGWAMECAVDCHQRLEDFAKAEVYMRQTAQRYEASSLEWYLWCRWTQRGNLFAARLHAQLHVKTFEASPSVEDRVQAALFHYAEGRQARALEILRQTFALGHNPTVGLQAALLADELKDPKLRDSLLDESIKAAWFQRNDLAELIHDFQNALADPAIPFDAKVNDWRMHLLPAGETTARRSFIGQFLTLRGQADGATPYLQLAAASPFAGHGARVMAGLFLARRQIKPNVLRTSEWDKDATKVFDLVKQAYVTVQTGKFKEIERLLNEALKLQPESLDALFARAMTDQAQHRFADAVISYTECLKQLPDAPEFRLGRAYCEESAHDEAAALTDYEKVISKDPRANRAYLAAASILATCKDASVRDGKKAVDYARRCLDQPDNIANWNKHFVLAAALAETGDFKAAVAEGEKSLGDVPENIRPAINQVVNLYRNDTPLRLGR